MLRKNNYRQAVTFLDLQLTDATTATDETTKGQGYE